ncbi:hypothetical protein M3193_09290 [Sporosarcina luteola]|uniref:hypothetical protein n=1 Tax=Sporosarcina luteola TaxID=582850 RepID=UPI00203B3C0B|nr:hypothetical protein [Sporosarcina luteola]MCM3744335.1 hypothetical protein [Sporosarcina luteola]
MEEEYHNKKKEYLKKLEMQEIGFTILIILFIVQYTKMLGYVFGRWIWTGTNGGLEVFLLIFGVLPASYFSAKYLVKVIKILFN